MVHLYNLQNGVFQSTPSAWRVTKFTADFYAFFTISIHTLRVEGDWIGLENAKEIIISIHTLRVEGDVSRNFLFSVPNYFNPHPPRGG